MGAYVAAKSVYTFHDWWSLSRCSSCQFHRRWCTPVLSEMQAFQLNFEFVWPQNSFYFASVHFKWSLVHWREQRFGPCSHMAYTLHDGALTLVCKCRSFRDRDFWNCSWAHGVFSYGRIMSVFKTVLPEGPKITGVQYWLLTLWTY